MATVTATSDGDAPPRPAPQAVLILDHQTLYREAVAGLLAREADLHILQASTLEEMRERLAGDGAVALVLFRCRAGRALSSQAREVEKATGGEIPLALLDDRAAPLRDEGSASSLAGCIPATLPSEQLPHVIRLLLAGGRYTPTPSALDGEGRDGAQGAMVLRDRRVLQWLAEGATNKEVAAQLGLREVTVKVIIGRLLRRFGARNRAQLVGIARSRNLV